MLTFRPKTTGYDDDDDDGNGDIVWKVVDYHKARQGRPLLLGGSQPVSAVGGPVGGANKCFLFFFAATPNATSVSLSLVIVGSHRVRLPARRAGVPIQLRYRIIG